MSVHQFITEMKSKFAPKFYVDILHISPPCQCFSPAHTHAGKDDDQNEASLFTIGDLLKIVRPRIVTLEQTFGLHTRLQFRQHRNALTQMFTKLNYSVASSVLQLADYGLPSSRQRLVIIAAA